jgi:hypothetical protein
MIARVYRAALLASLIACAPHLQAVQIVNHTDRQIDALYVYRAGAADHGKSRGTLAPGAATKVEVAPGAIEVLAVSAKLQIDEHTRDKPSASQSIELSGPVEVDLYDEGKEPAGLHRPGVFGIAFTLLKAKPPDPEPPTEP